MVQEQYGSTLLNKIGGEGNKHKVSTREETTNSNHEDDDNSSRKHRKKLKKEKKKRKKMEKREKKKEKKRLKEEKRRNKDSAKKSEGSKNENRDDDRSRVPMTKEEWEAKQNVVRRVYDEDTGRSRLVKGYGEILEECVSRDRQMEINKAATKQDGQSFMKDLAAAL